MAKQVLERIRAGRAALLGRLRARERRDEELVRAAGERRALGTRGVHRRRRDRARPARGQRPVLRPRRAAPARPSSSRRRSPSGSSSGTSSSPATAPTACSARAEPVARSPASPNPEVRRSLHKELVERGALVPVEIDGPARQAVRPRRGVRRSSRRRRSRRRPSRSSRRSTRCSGTRSSWRACSVRLRLGGVLQAGEAPLGLLRPADPLRRPVRRPDRASNRPRSNRVEVLGLWWEEGFAPTPRRGLRRCDARRARCLPPLRRRRSPRVVAPARRREDGSSTPGRDPDEPGVVCQSLPQRGRSGPPDKGADQDGRETRISFDAHAMGPHPPERRRPL